MQQTTKYKFNLIETSDTFSPDALNANARTAEAQLAALADADAALEQTIASTKSALQAAIGTAGKTCRIAYGSYVGTGYADATYGPSITTDFRPLVLFVGTADNTPYGSVMFRSNNGGISNIFSRLDVT